MKNLVTLFIFLFAMPTLVMAVDTPDSSSGYESAMQVARAFQSAHFSKDDLAYHTREMQSAYGLGPAAMLLPSCLMQSKLPEKALRASINAVVEHDSFVRPELVQAMPLDDNTIWMWASGSLLNTYMDNMDPSCGGDIATGLRSFFYDTRSNGQSCIDNDLMIFGAQVLCWENGMDKLLRQYIWHNYTMNTRSFVCCADALIEGIQTRVARTKDVAKSVVSIIDTMLNSRGVQNDPASWMSNVEALNSALETVHETVEGIRSDIAKLGL